MLANDVTLVWLLGYLSAVAVFHVLGLTRPVPVMEERPSSLPDRRRESR